jgi:hypothetical protein
VKICCTGKILMTGRDRRVIGDLFNYVEIDEQKNIEMK